MGNIALTDVIPQDSLERQLYFIEKCKAYVADLQEKLGRPLTCCTQTFGCQMNARDSEKLLGILTEIGYVPVETEEADLVLYNTCTVRENANLRVYGRLGHLNGLKKKNPHMIIALCGCMMQETQVVEKIKQSYRFVDIMFGTFNIFKLAELLYSRWTQEDQIIDIWDSTKEVVEELPTMRKYPFKSGVNIMYGCNNFCSYCIVPYVRGREKSREPKEIIMEIERLVKDGVKEVMLLGQNVNSYGKNLSVPVTFAELLQEVEKIDGLERIRFMTPHPKDLSDDLIDVMSKSKKICNHVHLPVQSGSSRLLKLMNRNYTKEHYLELVDKIRSKMPDVSLTTDIIVGFPGETEEDVKLTEKAIIETTNMGVLTERVSQMLLFPQTELYKNRKLYDMRAYFHDFHDFKVFSNTERRENGLYPELVTHDMPYQTREDTIRLLRDLKKSIRKATEASPYYEEKKKLGFVLNDYDFF